MSHLEEGPLASYNSLQDRHLAGYFANTRMKKHLVKSGLVSKRGAIVSETTYRLNMAKKEHKKHVKDLLATAIVHKALDAERVRQHEIKRRLDDIYKTELVRRVQRERSRKGDEDIVPLLSPREKSSRPKSRRRSKNSSLSSNSPREEPRMLSPSELHFDEETGKLYYHVDKNHIQEVSPPVQDDDSSPYTRQRPMSASCPLPTPPSSTPPRRSKTATPGRRKPKLQRFYVLSHTEPAVAHRIQLQSMAEVTMKFLGSNVHINNSIFADEKVQEVMILQQHCGGNTICLFRELLPPHTVFSFISRRHRGAPFGLTFYIDGVQDIRLSACCEYKHKPGHKLGGKNGHFSFVKVEGAAPCYRCQVAASMKHRKKYNKQEQDRDQEEEAAAEDGDAEEEEDETLEVIIAKLTDDKQETEETPRDNPEETMDNSTKTVADDKTKEEETEEKSDEPKEEEVGGYDEDEFEDDEDKEDKEDGKKEQKDKDSDSSSSSSSSSSDSDSSDDEEKEKSSVKSDDGKKGSDKEKDIVVVVDSKDDDDAHIEAEDTKDDDNDGKKVEAELEEVDEDKKESDGEVEEADKDKKESDAEVEEAGEDKKESDVEVEEADEDKKESDAEDDKKESDVEVEEEDEKVQDAEEVEKEESEAEEVADEAEEPPSEKVESPRVEEEVSEVDEEEEKNDTAEKESDDAPEEPAEEPAEDPVEDVNEVEEPKESITKPKSDTESEHKKVSFNEDVRMISDEDKEESEEEVKEGDQEEDGADKDQDKEEEEEKTEEVDQTDHADMDNTDKDDKEEVGKDVVDGETKDDTEEKAQEDDDEPKEIEEDEVKTEEKPDADLHQTDSAEVPADIIPSEDEGVEEDDTPKETVPLEDEGIPSPIPSDGSDDEGESNFVTPMTPVPTQASIDEEDDMNFDPGNDPDMVATDTLPDQALKAVGVEPGEKVDGPVTPLVEGNKDVDLTSVALSPEQVDEVATLVETKHEVDTLTLRNAEMGDEDIEKLSEAIKTSDLKMLNLNVNKIGPEGAKHVAASLKENKTIKMLLLHGNPLGDEGVQHIVSALVPSGEESGTFSSHLKNLDLGDCGLDEQGGQHIARLLQHNASITDLNISGNNFTLEGWKQISEALKVNTTLRALSLDFNKIGNDEAIILAEGLKENTCLRSVDLEGNQIGDEGGRHLLEAVKENKRLVDITLMPINNISKELLEEIKNVMEGRVQTGSIQSHESAEEETS